jgi:RHS repeat-associated protein
MLEESSSEEKPCAILTGKERDSESGLDFFGARYYSGPHGRFTSVDPKLTGVPFPEHLVQPQSWNMYAYALNNPLKFVDPDGEDVEVAVNFQGNLTDEEKKKILEAVKTYLSKLDVGKVVVRQSTDADKRTWGQFFTDLKPGNTGLFKIDATLEGGISKPGVAKFGDLLALREKDPGAFTAKAADTILHEVIAHQLKVGDQFDALTFQEWSPASPMYRKQQSDAYFLTRQKTLMDHTQRRAGDIRTPRPLYKDDQTKTEQRLKPIFRKYE